MGQLSDIEQEYLSGEAIAGCLESPGIKLIKFKDKNNTRGIIVFVGDKYSHDKHDLTYLDIIYSAQGNAGESMTFENADFKITPLVLYGGMRMFVLPIPSANIMKNRIIKFESEAQIDFKEIILRCDYYDFIGLKSGILYDDNSKNNEEKTMGLSKESGLEIQWFVTWRCNFKCGYCWQERQPHIYRQAQGKQTEISPQVWAKRINEFKPKLLYITGGEPTLYKELPRLISMLDGDIELIMSSNFGPSFNAKDFTKHVNPSRFSGLGFSLHPLQCDVDAFFRKLSFLTKEGFNNLLVEMVLHLENIPFAELVLKKCDELGVGVRFDPCVIEGEDKLYYISKRYMKLAEHYIGKSNQQVQRLIMDLICRHLYTKKHGLKVSRLLSKVRGNGNKHKNECLDSKVVVGAGSQKKTVNGRMPIYCPAGSKRISIDSEGNVYTCMSAIDRSKRFGELSLPHYSSIGNIFSKDFRLLDKPILCWESFRCSACDSQPLGHTWTEMTDNTKNIDLPLPE
ncbi:radical SAM/SPASM domain-containing protein [Candidatus Omnitrophota bacterium]